MQLSQLLQLLLLQQQRGAMSKTPEAEEGYVDFARLEEEIAG